MFRSVADLDSRKDKEETKSHWGFEGGAQWSS